MSTPIYYVLAHFWITMLGDQTSVNADIAKRHYTLTECQRLGAGLSRQEKKDPSNLIQGEEKLLVNSYFSLPIYIDKDSKI